MASVISSQLISDRPQSDGRRYIRALFVLEDNQTNQLDFYIGSRLVPSGFNFATWAANNEEQIIAILSGQEEDALLNLEEINDPLSYIQNPKWSTTKVLAKKVIYWMMREKDPRIVIWLKDFINYLKANYNAAEMADFLDINIATIQKMNNRINAILQDVDTVENNLEVFDNQTEDLN